MNHPAFGDKEELLRKYGHLVINVERNPTLEERFKQAITARDYKLAVKIQAEIRAAQNEKAAPGHH